VVATTIAAAPVAAQEPAAAPVPATRAAAEVLPPREFRLQNGLRVLVQRDARQPLVAFVVSYEVGHRDDPPGYEGLAHLVEHLAFRGSRHLGPYQGMRELEKIGALRKNGATGPDNTIYYALLPAQYLPLAFWVESERMGFTLERFSSESLALEAAIVRKEMLLRRPDEVELTLLGRLFPEGHPYRVTEERDARGAGLSDVQWFFQAGYRPDKATILVVGDVDPTLVESLARRYFGPIPNPPNALVRRPIPARAFPGRERVTISRLVNTRRLIMVWPAPVPGSRDELTLRVLLRIAVSGRRSVGRALRKAKLAEGADVGLFRHDGATFVVVEPTLNAQSNFHATENAVERYMFDLAEQPPTPDVVKRARDLVKRDFSSDAEDPLEHALLHLDALRHGGRPFNLKSTLARLDSITASDVVALAQKYLDPYHRLSTWYGDLRFEPTVPMGGDYIKYEVFR
jgi:zinc protease